MTIIGSAVAMLALGGCDGRSGGSIRPDFPGDEAISAALLRDYRDDPGNAQARELVQVLGGPKGSLRFDIRQVVWRQGAYEVHYDASVVMAQAGTESLRQLYATLVPAGTTDLADKSLAGHEAWLAARAQALEKSAPQQAAQLRGNLDALGKCYRTVREGEAVRVMEGLRALVSPARDGLYAEKLEAPRLRLQCLPSS